MVKGRKSRKVDALRAEIATLLAEIQAPPARNRKRRKAKSLGSADA
jgi:hypothetical protein